MDDLLLSPQLKEQDTLNLLHQQAIDAALSCRWEEAEKLNKEIIKTEPENIESLNRLARAFFELGRYTQAKKIYQQVLSLDPYNTIAQKNLKRAQAFKKDDKENLNKNNIIAVAISPSLFLEESGITRVINLVKVAEPAKLSRLYSGLTVNLITKQRGISVTDTDGNYLGVLTDDISHQLLRLIKGGNKYQALIKSVKSNGLSILVREIFRSKKFKNQPSFLDHTQVNTYSADNILLTYDDNSEETADQEIEEA